MPKKAQRPIDVKDTLWSVIGKDELDAAAELLWNGIRHVNPTRDNPFDQDFGPYHVQLSATQEAAQRAVIAVLGSAVPALLRQRAADYEGKTRGYLLHELADEIEAEHGN